ncbi:uncharacterized protein LOC131687819 [Topomyia yanbarensis]|uniref:uncharacterized protein LOC131687819 n=1 Tax=Topomyia yanbarensis TaxID=2498891 RepID=UPI00273BAFEE|nr:uncharacterized protein LOC131687819 [Topomyia yanbarensis]
MEQNKGTDPQVQYDCVICNCPDHVEDMVACDTCQLWFHYSCAKVDASIKTRHWLCESCGPLDDSEQSGRPTRTKKKVEQLKLLKVPAGSEKTSGKSIAGSKTSSRKIKNIVVDERASVSSSVRARLELELGIIEEQQKLQELELSAEKEMRDLERAQEKLMKDQELAIEVKRLAEERAFQEQKLAEEREFRKKQMEVRKQSIEDKAKIVRQLSQYGSSKGSIGPSEPNSDEKVEAWLRRTVQKNPEAGQKSKTVHRNGSPNLVEQHPGSPLLTGNLLCPTLEDRAAPNSPDVSECVPLDRIDGKMQSNVFNDFTPLPFPNKIVMQTTNEREEGPSSRQIAARQVMGKDLPTFSGDPEEWSIWISNFERSTVTCGFSQDENLIRLQRSLKGQALETVRSRLLSPAGVPHVIKTLQMRYGRPEILIRTMIEKIRLSPSLEINDLESVIEFGNAVDNLVEHLKNAKQHVHLSNPALLHDLVAKLPVDYRLKWSAFKGSTSEANLNTFGAFMTALVELAYEVADDLPTGEGNNTRPKKQAFVQTHTDAVKSVYCTENDQNNTSERSPKKTCIVCKSDGHRVADCFRFKSLTLDERLKVVHQSMLCRTCLNYHGRWPCKTWKGCGIEGCRLRHHTLLHPAAVHTAVSTSHRDQLDRDGGPIFRILPVTLFGKTHPITIFAFIDEGSQLTLLEEEVAKHLEIDGILEPLNLQWTGNVKRYESDSRRVTVDITGSNTSKRFKLSDARTVGRLLLPSQTMCYHELAAKFPHLRGLPLNDYDKVEPKLLIGLDNLKLTVPLKVREGGWHDPIATKCRLGWSIYGCSQIVTGRVVSGVHVAEKTQPDKELNELVREFLTVDNAVVTCPSLIIESDDDKRARILLKSLTKRIPSGFETGLLWKENDIRFPHSYGMAYRRLQSLEKKLGKDPQLYDCVRQQIIEYQDKGYAHKTSCRELSTTRSENTWYLPLGVVVNPKKPNKVRLIWDAAAKVEGVSLNSALLKGPDMIASLPVVLSQFRLYRYALAADIKEMFHRIRIREADRQFQRFLWRDTIEFEPQVFVMDVAIFGSTCSPCSAQYIKNLNAVAFSQQYPRETEAIIRYHYVDDYLDSFGTIEEAVQVGSTVKMIHAKGGFEIRNFMSNSKEIMERIGSNSAQTYRQLTVEKTDITQTVLGMKWILSSDDFTFIFEMNSCWGNVLEDTCYFPEANQETYSSLQIHIFVDASESAYASVAYFRVISTNGPLASLVAAKSKVAPLKMQTIPRLELQAAVLGTRLLSNICSMHSLPITQRFLWTDSKTVLSWIYSNQRKYPPYVGFRVSEILSTTNTTEWRWLPSKLNVADDATKWGTGPKIDVESRWFRGPDILLQSDALWPSVPDLPVSTVEDSHVCLLHHSPGANLIDSNRFSKWERLLRTQAFVNRFISNTRTEPRESGGFTQQEFAKAERCLRLQAQAVVFINEVDILNKTRGVPQDRHASVTKSSSIYKSWPFMDEQGVIRKRGRISSVSWIPYEAKYPTILPRQNRITFLLADWFHRRFNHANRETIVNEMRQRFEIPKLRSLIAEVIRSCVWCKVFKARPTVPPMAPLPKVRLTPFIRPFTFVGSDYFGPVLVKLGRSNVKRWIGLFTCLTIRAVHMEVIHSLSTESCVMAVRRFVSRRGAPAEIFSDNGTNFQGANKQLRKEMKERNTTMASIFTNANTRWNFNPPAAPHMGGVWERMVRSVKVAIKAFLESSRKPDEETLETVVLEAEAMINSRPLTYIPLESADQESLTPNHFLLGSSNGVKQQPVLPINGRTTLRSSWKLAQHLADEFWRRWIKEYIPVISRRSKWFDEIKEIAEGDLVLVVDGTVRNQWLRGKVEKVVQGSDGHVRQPWIKTMNGTVRRPAVKLALLDVLEPGEPDIGNYSGSREGGCDSEYPQV